MQYYDIYTFQPRAQQNIN